MTFRNERPAFIVKVQGLTADRSPSAEGRRKSFDSLSSQQSTSFAPTGAPLASTPLLPQIIWSIRRISKELCA